MSILALDLSLTATGWARSDGKSGVIKPAAGYDRGVDRLRWIRWYVIRLLDNVQLVVVEGYAFGRIQQAHHLGELGGVIRCAIADRDIPFVEIAPNSVKKFATGSGAAKKPLMLGAAIDLLGYTGRSTDEADALWLLAMAKAHYFGDTNGKGMTDKALEALAAVQFPVLPTLSPEPADAR